MSNRAPHQPLSPDELRRVCKTEHLQFETTAELEPIDSIIGQPRGTRAIDFGITIGSPGFNIYVLGETGTGRTTAIRRFLEERAGSQAVPDDWVYVNNFTAPHRPRAIPLPAGHGTIFHAEMEYLLQCLEEDIKKTFEAEAYEQAVEAVSDRYETQQNALFEQVRSTAAGQGFALVQSASGPSIAPVVDGEILSPQAFDGLPAEVLEEKGKQIEELSEELDGALKKARHLEEELRQEIRSLNREVGATAIHHHFDHWREQYQENEGVLLYLNEMEQDVLDNLGDFTSTEEGPTGQPADLGRYAINLLVDNSPTRGAPVIVEPNPTYHNLVGRIEYEIRQGMMSTDFTNLLAGSLHRANGGYLVINAHDILRHGDAWMALKRAIGGAEIRLQAPESREGAQVLAKSLDPQPVPLDVKVILLGSAGLYYELHQQEEEFDELFKVKAEFDSVMPRDDEHETEYARFIASRCRLEGLPHFDRRAVEKVVEYGSLLCQDRRKLSTHFGWVADLVRESGYWASQRGREIVEAQDVEQALKERRERASLLEEQLREQITDGTVFIDTQGAVVGQVNGLTVLEVGDYPFGGTSRISARTFMGETGVVNIEREVEMSGPIHNKGILILSGYLGGKYAQNHPLSLSASLTFEQNYSGIEGDSASSSELYALLSSIGGIPLKQAIAVTGSINQRGDIQAIGGVNEKVEGFYDVCRDRGLTGDQGVIIPAANVHNLMLREEIVAAAAEGRFHVWAIDNVDDGIELLTGLPAGEQDEKGKYTKGSVHAVVQKRLRQLARDLKAFGDKDS